MTTLVSFVLGAIILGVALWLRAAVQDVWQRRKRRITRRLQMVVLVDQGRRTKRRTCFWKSTLRTEERDLRYRVRIRYVSLASELGRQRNPAHKLFSIDATDFIVVNWDAMNGDPVYGSDRVYDFLAHYRPDMRSWLARGGTLIVESQGASWGCIQHPYDCFTSLFPGSEVQLSSDMWTMGQAAAVMPGREQDPVARNLTDSDLELTKGGLWERRSWFPRRRLWFTNRLVAVGAESLDFIRRRQSHLYRGWFVKWSTDWTPVLIPRGHQSARSPSAKALLLYRRVAATKDGEAAPASGAVVLTTMFIASSELHQLIANLLDLADHTVLPDAVPAPFVEPIPSPMPLQGSVLEHEAPPS